MNYSNKIEEIISMFRAGREIAAADELRALARRLDKLHADGEADERPAICGIPPGYTPSKRSN